MIRELYYDRTPIFHSDGNHRRDYVYVDDLIDLAIAVQKGEGFDCVNCSSLINYSVNEMYEIASKIMKKNIKPEYANDAHYWEKYPELYEGFYKIKDSILKEEINKYSLCDNTYAKNEYNWSPKINIEEGLRKVIEYQCNLLSKL